MSFSALVKAALDAPCVETRHGNELAQFLPDAARLQVIVRVANKLAIVPGHLSRNMFNLRQARNLSQGALASLSGRIHRQLRWLAIPAASTN